MKKSRFLIIPKSNNFRDIINIKEIANELKIKGHDCITLTSQVSDKNLEFILKEEKFDCVFRVNKGKPEKVDRNIRFISWVSEISDLHECLDNFNENDLIYTLKKKTSNSKKIKISQMLGAANYFKNILTLSEIQCITDHSNSFQDIDISLISNYNRVDLFNGAKESIFNKSKKNSEKHKNFHQFLNSLENEYKIEIYSLVNYQNLAKNKNIKYNGEINNFNYFFEIFRKSKFNFLFEDDFLDFNTNFFNILLVEGTLIFNEKLLNQLQNYLNLEEDTLNYFIHFKSAESFKSNFYNHYDNLNKRLQIGIKASKLVRKKHLYKNRVDQILRDLAL